MKKKSYFKLRRFIQILDWLETNTLINHNFTGIDSRSIRHITNDFN